MTALFQPKGDRPQWEYVYDVLTGLSIGDVVTYEQLAEALDVDPKEFRQNRSPFYKAAARWGEEQKRALRPVVGVGYRVVEPWEHEPIAKGHHRKGRRSLARGRKTLANADRSLLDDEQRQRFDRIESTLGRQEDMIRRLDARQDKTERAVAEARQQHTITEERVTALEDALRRHGIDPAQPQEPSQ